MQLVVHLRKGEDEGARAPAFAPASVRAETTITWQVTRKENGGQIPLPERIERHRSHLHRTGEEMTTIRKEEKARRRLGLPQLAWELGNASKACQIMG